MSMWLSSTQPHIALWGGGSGRDGKVLRSGRPPAAAAAMANVEVGNGSSSAAAPDADMDVFDVTPPFAEAEGGRGAGGIDEGGCLLDAPAGTIRGQPGVMRYKVLNNR